MTQTTHNPFFFSYNTPFETPPFNEIKNEHFEPAFDEGIKRLDSEVQAIANDTQPATFENQYIECGSRRRNDGDLTKNLPQVVGKL